MLSVLVFLALIPLALIGAVILFKVARWLLPYALVAFGGLLLWLSHDTGFKTDDAMTIRAVGAGVNMLGILWTLARWTR